MTDGVRISTRRLLEIVLTKQRPTEDEFLELRCWDERDHRNPKAIKAARREAAMVLVDRIADKLGEP